MRLKSSRPCKKCDKYSKDKPGNVENSRTTYINELSQLQRALHTTARILFVSQHTDIIDSLIGRLLAIQLKDK